MQETRQHILNILRRRGSATVDEIVAELAQTRGSITHVTVRHHLSKLKDENLITSEQRNRTTRGRPQLVFLLTTQGNAAFPNNYQQLAQGLIETLATSLDSKQVNVIFEGLANSMANAANIRSDRLEERLSEVVVYLNEHGYDARWESIQHGYMLHTYNCPYHHVHTKENVLCGMDMTLISKLLGVVPRLASHMTEGAQSCSYFIPEPNK
jgi:predicted ArsR family transcriptional regulator